MKFSVIKQQRYWWTISATIILSGFIAMAISLHQFGVIIRPGLDFIGGTRLQFELDCTQPNNCTKPLDLSTVRGVLAEQNLASSSIQIIGTQQRAASIRTVPLDVEQRTKLQTALTEKIGAFAPAQTKIDTVGPTIGRQLLNSGLLALGVSFLGIVTYLTFRFQFDYAFFALVALLHDILMTVGIFSILGLVLGLEADSLFIVALLTISGFSVQDTVVIYDRVRENIKLHPDQPIEQIVDDSVTQSLSRSINTVFATLLTLFSLFLFGGETIKNFALTLIIGFTMGAYSSIFIASAFLAWWRVRIRPTITLV